MNISPPAPPRHASWCPATEFDHAACRFTVADLTLTDSQRVVVALTRARATAAIVTLVHHVGARHTLIALTAATGGELATAIDVAVGMLD